MAKGKPAQTVTALAAALGAWLSIFAGMLGAEPISYTFSRFPTHAFYRFDLGSGDTEQVGPPGEAIWHCGAALAPYGWLYAADWQTNELWRVETASGAREELGSFGIDLSQTCALAFDACGNLWLASNTDLYQVDPATGAAAFAAPLGVVVEGLTGDGLGLIGITAERLIRIDPASAAIHPFGAPLPFHGATISLDFDDTGRLWALHFFKPTIINEEGQSWLWELDPVTGEQLSDLHVPETNQAGIWGGSFAITPARGSCFAAVDVPGATSRTHIALAALLLTAGWILVGRI